jgi:hypothetical protein
MVPLGTNVVQAVRWNFSGNWPAPGTEDTELAVLMQTEAGHGEAAEVYPRVQARRSRSRSEVLVRPRPRELKVERDVLQQVAAHVARGSTFGFIVKRRGTGRARGSVFRGVPFLPG